MVSFFREKSTAAILGVSIMSFGTRAFFLTQAPVIVASKSDGIIYYLLQPLAALPGSLRSLLYLALVILQALRLNYALNETRMVPKQAFTTALAFILITALLPPWNNISSALVVNSMIVWLLFRVIRLYNTQNPKTLAYNIGLIAGTTVLLYYSSFPVILIVFFALASLRPFRLHEWIILLIGILTPFYFVAGWLYLNEKIDVAAQQLHLFSLQIIRPANLPVTISSFALAGIAVIAGIGLWQTNSGRMAIQSRKIWVILFVMLLLFIPVIYFMKGAWPDALLLASVPAASFISNTFSYPKRTFIPALFFWLFVALIVYNNWYVIKI